MGHPFGIRSLIVAAAGLAFAGAAQAQQLREVSIGLGSSSLVAASAKIAHELGLFRKHGLEPRFIVMDSANAATTALISRSVPFVVSGPAELVVAQARGQKVVLIASAYDGLGATLVLSKAVADKLGVAANAPVAARLKALDGLLLAAASPTATYKISFDGAAKAAGANVRFTHMAQTAMPAALESGAIQGYVASAPVWAAPVVKGSAVQWISGPKGELPREHTPASSSNVQAMRDHAEANPDLVKRVAAVFADFAKAIEERPAEVKATIAKLYPDIDAPTLDLIFASESLAWKTKPPTAEDVSREIAFVKASGARLPEIDAVDPASMLFR